MAMWSPGDVQCDNGTCGLPPHSPPHSQKNLRTKNGPNNHPVFQTFQKQISSGSLYFKTLKKCQVSQKSQSLFDYFKKKIWTMEYIYIWETEHFDSFENHDDEP
jgi:hypothetical protein